MCIIKGLFSGMKWGLGLAVALFALAFVIDLLGWVCSFGGYRLCSSTDQGCANGFVYEYMRCTHPEYDTGSPLDKYRSQKFFVVRVKIVVHAKLAADSRVYI